MQKLCGTHAYEDFNLPSKARDFYKLTCSMENSTFESFISLEKNRELLEKLFKYFGI